jgi:ABC-type transport system involved in multi-copper enzyme maturation permease subunit
VKPVALIAGNFVREQRWPIVVALAWILLLAAAHFVSDLARSRDDLLFLLQQVATYVLVFVVFFGISAIRNERKSRRILMVLAKGISRGQYIGGLLAGMVAASAIFCFALVLSGLVVLHDFGYAPLQVVFLMTALLIACLLTGAVALFFSVFLHPLVAAAATFGLLGVPIVLAKIFGPAWQFVLPVFPLLNGFYHLAGPGAHLPNWSFLVCGVLESILMWRAASWAFARKDVTVAVE